MRPPVVPMLDPITPLSAHSSSFGGLPRRPHERAQRADARPAPVLVVGLGDLVGRVHLRLPRRPVVVEEVGVERRQARLQPKLPVAGGLAPCSCRRRVAPPAGRPARRRPPRPPGAGGAPPGGRGDGAAQRADASATQQQQSTRIRIARARPRQPRSGCQFGASSLAPLDRARISFKSARALGLHTSVHGVWPPDDGAAEPAQDFVVERIT